LWPSGGLWRESDFLKFWSAQAISALGSRITRTALPMVAIVTLGASVEEVALLSALAVAPGVVVGLVMGGKIDRRMKRPLLVGADLVRAALLLTVPMAAWLGRLAIGQLYLVAAITGAATTLFEIADKAYLPALIGRGRLVEGNTKLETTEAIAEITGPGLAGLLVQAITAPLAIAFDSLSFLVSAGLLGAIRRPEGAAQVKPARPDVVHDLRLGLQASFGHVLVRPEFLVEAASSLTNGFFLALYSIYALNTLRLTPATLGLVISVGGFGALTGSLLSGRLAGRIGFGRAMILCLTLGRAAGLLIPLARGPEWLAVSCLVGQQLVGDAFLVAHNVLAISLRQAVLPQETLGRANATFHISAGLLLPIGALIAGPIAEASDARTALWVGSVGGLIGPLLLRFSAVSRLNTLPAQDMAGTWDVAHPNPSQ
jgi:MFS family permease